MSRQTETIVLFLFQIKNKYWLINNKAKKNTKYFHLINIKLNMKFSCMNLILRPSYICHLYDINKRMKSEHPLICRNVMLLTSIQSTEDDGLTKSLFKLWIYKEIWRKYLQFFLTRMQMSLTAKEIAKINNNLSFFILFSLNAGVIECLGNVFQTKK